MAFQLGAELEGVPEILKAFGQLSIGLQKKYIGSAVGKAARNEIASLKATTPRGPSGALRRSVGVKVEKAIVKPWSLYATKAGGSATARIGYRRGKTQKGAQFGGNAAWWLEAGVASRSPQNGSALRVPVKSTRKYAYLKSLAVQTQAGSAVLLRRIKAKAGNDMFEQWKAAALPRIEAKLKTELADAFQRAQAEAARRAARSAAGRSSAGARSR